MRILVLSLSLSCFFCACNQPKSKPKSDLLAQVFDQKLYQSDIKELFSDQAFENKEPELNVFVERWVRDQLIIHEAQQKTVANSGIDKLVNDYYNNLLKLKFERSILQENMSLEISSQELKAAYNSDKLIYALKEPLFKASYIQIEKGHDDLGAIRKLWRADNWSILEQLCKLNNISSFFKDNTWQSEKAMNTLIPREILKSRKLKKNLKFEASVDNAEFFLKIWDFKDKNEEPPLDYISDQLSNVIIHRRQKKLINEMTEQLYEKALKRNNIKIY